MPQIILHQFGGDVGVESGSPFCVKVHRILAFKGLEYQLREVGSPLALRRLNPGVNKVPVLEYDGELIPDSSRILLFLEERHPDPPLLPADKRTAALHRLLEDWADESLYWFAVYQRWAVDTNFEPFAKRAFARLPLPLRWFLPSVIRKKTLGMLKGQGIGRLPQARVLEDFGVHLEMLEGLLEGGPFLAGEQLAAGDISVFAPLRALAVGSMPQTATIIRQHALIVDWLRRVDQATTNEHTVQFV